VERASRGAHSLGILKDMLRTSPDTGISLHGVLFPSEGNLVGAGGSYCGYFDRRKKEGCSGGASLSEGFHEVYLVEGFLYWGNPKDEVFQRYAKFPVKGASISIWALLESLEGVRLVGSLRGKKYIWVPFLDPKVMKILSPSKALSSLGHTHLGSFFFGPGEY
jgi:hypothetical protein